MPKRDRFAYAALGFVAGLLLALLFLAWSVPHFRYPLNQQVTGETTGQHNAYEESEEPGQKPEWRYWAERLIQLEDTPAQWIMAAFAIVATGFSVVAVVWAKRAVRTNEAQVRAYFRITNIRFEWEPIPYNQGFKVIVSWENCGQSPAVQCVFMKDFVILDAEADENIIPSFLSWHMEGARPITSPVGQVHHSEICTIGGDDAAKLNAGRTKLVLFFAVRYKDVFGSTFIEEVCNVPVFNADPKRNIVRFRAYPYHNTYKQA